MNYHEIKENYKISSCMPSRMHHERDYYGRYYGLQHSRSSGNILFQNTTAMHKVHFKVDSAKSAPKVNGNSSTPIGILKRSKSFGSGEMKLPEKTLEQKVDPVQGVEVKGGYGTPLADETSVLRELGPLPKELDFLVQSSIQDPDTLAARELMELVRYLFEHLTENVQYAEPIAKFCMLVIEKEHKLTFLETLLNTCREWFAERDKLLFSKNRNQDRCGTPLAWLAFIKFLNFLYSQLKRHRHHFVLETKINGNTLQLTFLNLLCECCQVTFRRETIRNLSEMECLFFVLTAIGRDLEVEMPKRLNQLVDSIRNAFLNALNPAAVKKTLLQLIELHAARWQLSANAVMYYYPSSMETPQ